MNYPKIDTEEEIEINSIVIEEKRKRKIKGNSKGKMIKNSNQNSIENPKENPKENPNEKSKENPNENPKENPNEKSKENPNEKSKENPNEKSIENPKEKSKKKSKKKKEGSEVPKIEVLTIYFCLFLSIVAFSILIPIIPFYALKKFGANALEVGVIEAAYSGTQFISSLFLGVLSDKSFGRKKLLLICLFGLVVGLVITSFSQTLTQLILFRGFTGFFGGFISITNAMITDVVPIQYRARYLGLFGAVFGIAFVIGPTIGSALSKWELKGACYSSAILTLMGFIFALIFLKETYVVKKKMKFKQIVAIAEEIPVEGLTTFKAIGLLLKRPFLVRFQLSFFFANVGFTGLMVTYPLLVFKLRIGLDESNIGYIYMMNGFVLLLIQGAAMGVLSKKFHLQTLVYIMVPFGGIMIIILPEAKTQSTDILMMFLISLGSSFLHPCLMALISFTTKTTDRGTIMGLAQSSGALSRLIGPIAGGALFDVNYRLGFWISGGLLILTGIMMCGSKISFMKIIKEFEMNDIKIEEGNLPELPKKPHSINEWLESSDDF
ncbi:mfs transporter [Anaeramoeba ignava]|uniref:Mfs transporter n=1 Tax=Anaeramoeba ignava TaxID=1746090 RepID=A0A9Q0R689_ANAIG|nr:mfs transporter [Anaeramoeba ignava]